MSGHVYGICVKSRGLCLCQVTCVVFVLSHEDCVCVRSRVWYLC